MSEGFKCPECGGKSVAGIKCKSEIPDHIGFRWEKRTVAQAKKEWEEFKNDEYLEDDNLF